MTCLYIREGPHRWRGHAVGEPGERAWGLVKDHGMQFGWAFPKSTDATPTSSYGMDLCNSHRLWFVSCVVKVKRDGFVAFFFGEWGNESKLTWPALISTNRRWAWLPFLLNWGYHINSILNLMSLIIQSGQVRIPRVCHILHNKWIILKAMIIYNINSRRMGRCFACFEVLFPLSWATMILRRGNAPSFKSFQGPVLVLDVTWGWRSIYLVLSPCNSG